MLVVIMLRKSEGSPSIQEACPLLSRLNAVLILILDHIVFPESFVDTRKGLHRGRVFCPYRCRDCGVICLGCLGLDWPGESQPTYVQDNRTP